MTVDSPTMGGNIVPSSSEAASSVSVLYLTSTLQHAGPTNQLYNLVKYLDRQKFTPHLVTLSPEPLESRWPDFERLGVRLHSLGLSRFEGLFLARSRLMDYMRTINPGIIQAQGIRADSLLASITPGTPWLLVSHNYPYQDYTMKFGRIKGTAMALLHLACMKRCRYVVSCSKTNADSLQCHGIDAIPIQNGVDVLGYRPADADAKLHLRRSLGFHPDASVFISVGSLIPLKNMRTLVEAFMRAETGSGTLLVVLGNGPEMASLKALARHHPGVRFMGSIKDVDAYLKASDVFISASLSEGLPNAVLEAMACGLPCILSDIPSHRELFEAAEQHLFFPPSDVHSLEQLLRKSAAMDLTELGMQSRRIVERGFSDETMSGKYQKLYSKMIDGPCLKMVS